jgi:protein phosphatase methylesterase 1
VKENMDDELFLTPLATIEWFTDLSEKFLGCPASKLLILAGTDRLDKTLTIAQMQGKEKRRHMGNLF